MVSDEPLTSSNVAVAPPPRTSASVSRPVALAVVHATLGDVERAEELAMGITHRTFRTLALTGMARQAGDSPRARRLVALALHVGHWTDALELLARLEPAALTALADERRHRFTT